MKNVYLAADINRLVRELDVALNGEDGAAKQASLCDVVAQVSKVAREQCRPVLANDDNKTLWGIVANAGRARPRMQARWMHVVVATGRGSTAAMELCKRFGFDPHEKV